MVEDGKGNLRLVDIAPEVEGALDVIKYFVSNGINVGLYHTNANYEEANKGIDAGASVATHLGNVMTGLHHRDIGTLGACILRDEVDCEMICDGLHVSLPMIEIYLRLKNHNQLMMVSDNVAYAGLPVISKQYDVDHFIPWSFVMNDELWNLMPMDSSLNSSKSNRLPKWDPFFIRFAKNQYIMYQLIHEKAGIRKLYESCYRDNLHSIWAGQELYRKGNSEEEFMGILQKNMQPVYDSARRQGYEVWNRN